MARKAKFKMVQIGVLASVEKKLKQRARANKHTKKREIESILHAALGVDIDRVSPPTRFGPWDRKDSQTEREPNGNRNGA